MLVILLLNNAVQSQEAQYRQGHLKHHQRHRYRAELVVQRQVLETELRKGHEVIAHSHEDGNDCCCKKPPFFPALIQAQAQHKQENGNGAHVHRSGGKRLRPPVKRQGFGGLLKVLLAVLFKEFDCGRFVRIHRSGRCPAVEIRDHHVGQFLPAVAPGRGIAKVKSLVVGALLGELGAATHGVWCVLCQRQQLVGIGCYARNAHHKQQGRCHNKVLPLLGADGMNELRQGIQQHHNGKVVGNLLMVGFDLHAKGQAEEGRAKDCHDNRFFALLRMTGKTLVTLSALLVILSVSEGSTSLIGINQRRQHPRHKGNCLHFGVVAHLDYLEIVAAESHGYCTANGHRPAYTKGQEQQERAKQSNKQIRSRALAGK